MIFTFLAYSCFTMQGDVLSSHRQVYCSFANVRMSETTVWLTVQFGKMSSSASETQKQLHPRMNMRGPVLFHLWPEPRPARGRRRYLWLRACDVQAPPFSCVGNPCQQPALFLPSPAGTAPVIRPLRGLSSPARRRGCPQRWCNTGSCHRARPCEFRGCLRRPARPRLC